MSKFENNATIALSCQRRIRALNAHVGAKTEIGVSGVLRSPSELVAIYQGVLDAQAALIVSRAQVDADLATRREWEAKREATEFALKSWVLNHLGPDSHATMEFGYAPPRKPTRTAEEAANAVKLAQATRKARGTMGKRQRLKIRGSLDAPGAAGDHGSGH